MWTEGKNHEKTVDRTGTNKGRKPLPIAAPRWTRGLGFIGGREAPSKVGVLSFSFFLSPRSFFIALLRYNSDIIQFTNLKPTVQWLLIYAQSCTAIIVETFPPPHIPYTHSLSLPISP